MQTFLTSQLPDRVVVLEDGRAYLNFSGTDYLGLGYNEDFRRYLNDGFTQYGTHFGSSRNNSLKLRIFSDTENAIAKYINAPCALSVSSGMWAGQLVMKEIENIAGTTSGSVFYHYAPGVHPALWGDQYSAQSGAWIDWAGTIINQIAASPIQSFHIICTDSVGSPRVEKFNFSVFDQLPSDRNIWLIADDSHGIGVTGESGKGIYQQAAALENVNLIVCASLNKGMGIPAGVILAESNVIDKLKDSPWFSGASPFAPAYSFALQQLLKDGVYQNAFEQMKSNIRCFKNQTNHLNLFSGIDDYPVFCGKHPALFQFLLDNEIMASSFPYPLITDLPVTRLAITARHKKEDLDRLAEVCIQFKND